MGILNWIREIGRRKREGNSSAKGSKVCVACRGTILKGQPKTKQLGYYFHRECWKAQKKASL